MTLALDTSWASVKSDPALVSSLTTGAATPPAGSVLFASVLFDTVAATAITMSTVTGSTSAWTTVENPTVSNGLVGLYWATVTSSISTTVEAAFSTSSDCALKVYIATGANVVTPVGAHGHTLITHSPTAVSYTATAVGSIGLVVVENDTGRAVGISATTTDETLTSNSKGTIAHQSSPSAGLNAQTFTVTGTSAGPACAWLEIMPAAGGSPAMDTLPVDHIKVEVAFDTVPDDPSPVWTDVSQWVRLEVGVAITTGRADEYAAVQTGTCKLALDNTDGRFTPGNVGSPYWPNVKIRRKLRVSYTNPAGGPTIYRFTGYMEEWPVEWPTGGQTYSVSQISATDRFKRLGDHDPLHSIITEEYLLDGPVANFTLGEPTGSTTAGDTSKSGYPALASVQLGTGGVLTFGANTGPPTDGLPAPAFTPVNATNGLYLQGTGPAATGTDGTLECFMLTSVAAQQCVAQMTAADGSWIQIYTTAAGKLAATNSNPVYPFTNFALLSSASFDDGHTHHVALTQAVSGGTITVNLVVDGVSVASGTYTGTVTSAWQTINIGGTAQATWGALFNGTISNVAVYASALSVPRLLSHSQAGTTGFSGERSDQRIARLASYAGVPTAEQSLESGLSTSIAAVDITGMTPLKAMQDVADTEGGLLFIDGAGQLTFQARSHRYNTSSAFSVDAADIDPSMRPVVNDLLLVNDVTANRPGGITFRAENAASVLDYGRAAITPTLLTTSDNEVMSAANSRANRTATIDPRIPSLIVDLLTSRYLHAAAMLLGMGSRITLTGLPSQASASSFDLFLEGWSETISTSGWILAWNTSAANQSTVWVLGVPGFSELGITTRLSY